MSRWISARWPLLTSLSLHTILVLTVMQINLSSNTHSLPNILFVDIIEEKEIPETRNEPAFLFKKKERNSPIEEKEEKKSSPLPKLEEKIVAPPVGSKEEAKPEEMLKEEARPVKQKNWEEPKLQEAEKSLQKGEKHEGPSAPDLATKASVPSLESAEQPEKMAAFKGAAGLGEMRGMSQEGSGGEKSREGEKPGKITARVGESAGGSPRGEGKGRPDLLSYLGTVRMRIEKAKKYPREARRKGYEGRVIVSFQVDRKGNVGEIKLVQSCGHPELDEEGMATLRRASPFPSPLVIEKEKLVLEVPLLFKIEEEK